MRKTTNHLILALFCSTFFLLSYSCTPLKPSDLDVKGDIINGELTANDVQNIIKFIQSLPQEKSKGNPKIDIPAILNTTTTVFKNGIDQEELRNVLQITKYLFSTNFMKKNEAKLKHLITIATSQPADQPTSSEPMNAESLIPMAKIAAAVLSEIQSSLIFEYIEQHYKPDQVKDLDALTKDAGMFFLKELGEGSGGTIGTLFTFAGRYLGNQAKATARQIGYAFRKHKPGDNDQATILNNIKDKKTKREYEALLTWFSSEAHKDQFNKVLVAIERANRIGIINKIAEAHSVTPKYTERWLNSVGTADNNTQSTILTILLALQKKIWLDESKSKQFGLPATS